MNINNPYNPLLATVNHADPILSFDINLQAGILLCGSSTGCVSVWDISTILTSNTTTTQNNSYIDLKSSLTSAYLQNSNKSIRQCHILCRTAEEGIKHVIFGTHGSVFAVVGDSHIRYWDSIASDGYRSIRIERAHNYPLCVNTVVLSYGHRVCIVSPGTSDGILVDLISGEQQRYTYTIPSGCEPIGMTDKYIMLLQTNDDGSKQLLIRSLTDNDILYRIDYDRTHKFYSAFQINQSYLLHICCSSKLKLWKLQDLATNQSTTNKHKPHAQYKMTQHKHRVISAALLESTHIASLSADAKLYLWHSGQLQYKYKNLRGEFIYQYPYIMKCYNNWCIYTSDDGIYAVDCSQKQ